MNPRSLSRHFNDLVGDPLCKLFVAITSILRLVLLNIVKAGFKKPTRGNSLVVQRIKDPALSLHQLGSLL